MARLISYLFHPLLLPTYLFLTLSYAFPPALDPIPASAYVQFISLIFIITFMLPVLSLGMLKTLGVVRSFRLETREERVLPFVITTCLYIAITFLFYYQSRIGLNDNFLKIMIIMAGLAFVATVLTMFFKVSIHSLTAWGIVGVIILLNKASEINSLFYPAIIAIVLTGFIMSARLKLQAHTLKEVMWGGIAGLATSIVGMFILF